MAHIVPFVTILEGGSEFREQRGACFGLCIRKLVCHIKAEYPILRESCTQGRAKQVQVSYVHPSRGIETIQRARA